MRLVLHTLALALVSIGLIAGSAQADEADDAFARAAEHYRQGRWQQAGNALAEWLRAYPQHTRAANARFFYGEALVQLGRWQEARQAFTLVLQQDPGGDHAPAAQFRAGEAAYMVGDDEAARRDLDAFHRAHADDPLNAYALPYLASLAMQDHDAAAVEKLFAEAIELYPEGPLAVESRFGLAQARHQLGRLEQAREGYRAVSQTEQPLAAQALVQLGAVENALGQYEPALEAFDAFARRFADSPLADKARLGRGFALYKLGRPAEAANALADLAAGPAAGVEASYWLAMSQSAVGNVGDAAATLANIQFDDEHPLAPAIEFELGDTLLRSGKADAAGPHFDRVLEHHSLSAWADDSLLGKIRLARDRQDHEACVRWADQLIDQFSGSPLLPQATLAKGQSLAALDKPAEAIAVLAPLVERASAAPDANDDETVRRAQATLAVSYAARGDFEAAQGLLAALGKDPSAAKLVADTTYRVAEAAQTAGNTTLAEQLFATVSGNAASTEIARRAQSGLAWSHFEAQRWADAASEFEQLLAEQPGAPLAAEAALMRGRALEHLDQSDAAEAMYQLVVDRYFDSPRAAEALWHSARLQDRLNQTEEARQRYAALVQQYPDFPDLDAALFRYGWLMRAVDPAKSDAMFEQLRTQFPDSQIVPEATLLLAERALDAEDFGTAERLVSERFAADLPAALRSQALYLSGRLNLARGRWEAARGPLETLLADDPQGELAPAATYLLAEASFRQGDNERAVQLYEQLAEQSPNRADAWQATAELHRAQRWLNCAAGMRSSR